VRKRTLFTLILGSIVVLAACGKETADQQTSASSEPPPQTKVTIGSANFPESQILAHIYAQGLKAKGYNTATKLNIGAREVYFPALEKGQIDFFPEYIGSALNFLTKQTDAAKPDAQKTYDSLVTELKKQKLTALTMADAADQDGVVVTKATADKYKLKKISDLKPVASQLVYGGPPECPTRVACLKGLQDVYGLKFKEFKSLDAGGPLTVSALKSNGVQVADLFTTDAQIKANDFVVLEQDEGKEIVGAENVVPIVRDAVLSELGDDFKEAVDAITAKLTTDGLTDLNKKVGIDKLDADDVAGAWLRENDLV
jgi:osmoprotectant transport system substrate-binding protein